MNNWLYLRWNLINDPSNATILQKCLSEFFEIDIFSLYLSSNPIKDHIWRVNPSSFQPPYSYPTLLNLRHLWDWNLDLPSKSRNYSWWTNLLSLLRTILLVILIESIYTFSRINPLGLTSPYVAQTLLPTKTILVSDTLILIVGH